MIRKYISLTILLIFSTILSKPTKDDFNQKFVEVARNGNPTVVSIISETIRESNFFNDFGRFDIPKEFEDMFPEFEERGRSLGSGVIIDKENG